MIDALPVDALPVDARPDGDVTAMREVLQAFAEVAFCAASHDLDELLHLVGQRICQLIGVRRCSVYLRSDDGLFYGQVGHTPGTDIDHAVKLLVAGVPADAFTLEIVDSKAPVVLTDAMNNPRGLRNTMRRWQVHDMLGVPLLFAGDVIGVIYVDDLERPHHYSPAEIEIAQSFAGLAALAIRQKALYTRLNAHTTLVEQQKRMLERLAEIHERLTRTVLSGASIGDILGELSRLVRKPVQLYTDALELVGSAAPDGSSSARRPVPLSAALARSPRLRRQVDGLTAEQPSALLPAAPEADLLNRRLVVRLIIDDEPAGFLEIVEVGQSITALDAKVAEHGAVVLGIEILAQRRQAVAEGQARDDFFHDLLHGNRPADLLLARAHLFGIDLGLPHVLLRVALDENNATDGRQRQTWVGDMLSAALGAPCVATVRTPEAVICLFGPFESAADVRPHELAISLSEAIHAGTVTGVGRAVISNVCSGAALYPQIHHDLIGAIALMERFEWRRKVAALPEFSLIKLFTDDGLRARAEALRFAQRLLGPLLNGGDGQDVLIETLCSFVETGGRIRATARHLGVHENTIRYRLARVRDLTGADHERLDDLVQLRLALVVLDLSRRLDSESDTSSIEPSPMDEAV